MANKKIDFSAKLKDLEGKETTTTLAKVVSEFIGSQTEGKIVKLYDWHRLLQNGTVLELDKADSDDLKKIIEDSKNLFVYVKGQLLDVLENSK